MLLINKLTRKRSCVSHRNTRSGSGGDDSQEPYDSTAGLEVLELTVVNNFDARGRFSLICAEKLLEGKFPSTWTPARTARLLLAFHFPAPSFLVQLPYRTEPCSRWSEFVQKFQSEPNRRLPTLSQSRKVTAGRHPLAGSFSFANCGLFPFEAQSICTRPTSHHLEGPRDKGPATAAVERSKCLKIAEKEDFSHFFSARQRNVLIFAQENPKDSICKTAQAFAKCAHTYKSFKSYMGTVPPNILP